MQVSIDETCARVKAFSRFGSCTILFCILVCAELCSWGFQDAGLSKHHHSGLRHNADTCADCHSIPKLGGSSPIAIQRQLTSAPDSDHRPALASGSHGAVPLGSNDLRGRRISLNLLGDGYVEAVSDETLRALAQQQSKATSGKVHGEYTKVASTGGATVVGRFGWKAQHGSILSAAADALNNEMGIPNALFPGDQKRDDQSRYKSESEELAEIVRFIRSSKPITPDKERSATPSTKAGSHLFDAVGCAICHVPTLTTAPYGTKTATGGVVSREFSKREFHPFSDFLLHDVGTGDGVLQNVKPQDYDLRTANKFRTAPLWGVRFRSWLMHDGASVTYHQAIMRHAGESSDVIRKYQRLTPAQKEDLRQFLDSL